MTKPAWLTGIICLALPGAKFAKLLIVANEQSFSASCPAIVISAM